MRRVLGAEVGLDAAQGEVHHYEAGGGLILLAIVQRSLRTKDRQEARGYCLR